MKCETETSKKRSFFSVIDNIKRNFLYNMKTPEKYN